MKMDTLNYFTNFMIGAGSVLDIAPFKSKFTVGSRYDDAKRLREDWNQVGSYLDSAFKDIEKLNNDKKIR